MAIDYIENIKSNCWEFAKTKKSCDVLRSANGKNHYIDIAKLVGLHPTTTSGLLRKAEKLGLAKKIKNGIYKKIPGILGYMPSKGQIENISSKNVSDIINKIVKTKNRPKLNPNISVNKIDANMNKMADAYKILYATENVLREMIRKVFSQNIDWWKNSVHIDIQKKVEEIITKEPYYAAERNDKLEYTHLGQLKEIIISKKNWKLFLPYLNEQDKNAFSITINKAIPSRNAIGHCIPLKPKDLKVVDVRFEDIIKMIK